MKIEEHQASQYNYIQAFYLSWFSPKLYRDVAKNWKGIAAGYLVILLLLTWLPSIFQFISIVHNFQQSKQYAHILEQVPKISLRGGRLAIDKPSPYIIKSTEGEPYIVMDTSGKYKRIEDIKGYLLVTDKMVYAREPDGKVHEHSLEQIDDIKFGKKEVSNFADKSIYWILVFLYPACVSVSFLFRIGLAITFSIGAMVVNKLRGFGLSYLQCLRLSIVAMTPVLLLVTFLEWISYYLPQGFLIVIILNVLYVIFAVHCCRSLNIGFVDEHEHSLTNPSSTLDQEPSLPDDKPALDKDDHDQKK